MPILKSIRQRIGKNSIRKAGVKVTLSIMQNMRKTEKVNPKLISEDTFFEKRKRYIGTLILENIFALSISELIPVFVACNARRY